MALDVFTRANLELTKTLREGKVRGSLFGVIDKTKTAMGARLLKRYINEPLQSITEINGRLDAVEEIKNNMRLCDDIEAAIDGVFDLERLISRISYATLDAKNCLSLKASLEKLPKLKSVTSDCKTALLSRLSDGLDIMEDMQRLLESAIHENPPVGITSGGIIKEGYNSEVDELREASTKRVRNGLQNLKQHSSRRQE